jgi:hypothetical protein
VLSAIWQALRPAERLGHGTWQVVVAQNTNAILGIPPEVEGIKTPIAIPGTVPGT